jgi:hypothetical protein
MTEEIQIPIADLNRVTIKCVEENCGTEFTIDLKTEAQNRFERPPRCPICGGEFKNSPLVKELQNFYSTLRSTGAYFRVKKG